MNTDYETWSFEELRAECVKRGILESEGKNDAKL